MEVKTAPGEHRCVLINRHQGALNGVLDVLSFDVGEILLETEQGMLMIKGNGLHVNRLSLDKGEIDIEGQIDSLVYSDISSVKNQGESFWGRIFK